MRERQKGREKGREKAKEGKKQIELEDKQGPAAQRLTMRPHAMKDNARNADRGTHRLIELRGPSKGKKEGKTFRKGDRRKKKNERRLREFR